MDGYNFVGFVFLYWICVKGAEASAFDCDFETDFCRWDNAGWTITEYSSVSSLSGPSTLFDGAYIYLDTLDSAVTSATLSLSNIFSFEPCFTFAYHMKGVNTIGWLAIEVFKANSLFQQWNISGHQGNDWLCGQLYLFDEIVDTEVRITGHKKENENLGLIALDRFRLDNIEKAYCTNQLSMSSSACEIVGSTPSPTVPSTLSPTSSGITNTVANPTEPSFWSDTLTYYAIGVPGGVLLLSILVIISCVCFRRRRDKNYGGPPSALERDPRHIYQRSSETPSMRYPNVFDNIQPYNTVNEEEQYDYILDKDIYLDSNQKAGDQVKGHNTDKDDYTILPAITKPYAPHDGDYLSPNQMNIPQRPGKKISISEQGDVQYTDVRDVRNGPLAGYGGNYGYLTVQH